MIALKINLKYKYLDLKNDNRASIILLILSRNIPLYFVCTASLINLLLSMKEEEVMGTFIR